MTTDHNTWRRVEEERTVTDIEKDGRSKGLPISISGVSKVYDTSDGPLLALDEISLDIKAGEFLSIVGPSGCGKSTLLMLISGLIKSTTGEIKIADTVVKNPYTDIGFVFQQDFLMDWRTVLDNILLPIEIKKLGPAEKYRERAFELLDMVGLAGFENRYPYELSGGMRQRVSICRALITSPPLLLMDEPFGALDSLTREQMTADLVKIWQKNCNTLLFITHNIYEAVFLADRVLVMSKRPGKVLYKKELVDLKRPRDLSIQDTPEFQKHASEIRQTFVKEGILK